ncbi:unnamed protein product [Haemonchus placei]|uniref:Transposase n=1 Tax=Haemonchus placei TaxID=6290 RepID=A0A0N4W1A0_HAEPC|nr:unnamed protein product [Haemonchus placei]
MVRAVYSNQRAFTSENVVQRVLARNSQRCFFNFAFLRKEKRNIPFTMYENGIPLIGSHSYNPSFCIPLRYMDTRPTICCKSPYCSNRVPPVVVQHGLLFRQICLKVKLFISKKLPSINNVNLTEYRKAEESRLACCYLQLYSKSPFELLLGCSSRTAESLVKIYKSTSSFKYEKRRDRLKREQHKLHEP